jgi:uncharacterized spore protein YtfJ
MNLQIDSMLDRLAEFLKTEANTKTVIGDSFKLGKFECVPVIKLGLGFGTGGQEADMPKNGHNEGGGLGAGIGITPIVFLVTHLEDITFIPTKGATGLGSAFEQVPGLIEKYLEKKAPETEPVM